MESVQYFNLPVELTIKIYQYLTPKELSILILVSKKFKEMAGHTNEVEQIGICAGKIISMSWGKPDKSIRLWSLSLASPSEALQPQEGNID